MIRKRLPPTGGQLVRDDIVLPAVRIQADFRGNRGSDWETDVIRLVKEGGESELPFDGIRSLSLSSTTWKRESTTEQGR
jgi:hypothetical protein